MLRNINVSNEEKLELSRKMGHSPVTIALSMLVGMVSLKTWGARRGEHGRKLSI